MLLFAHPTRLEPGHPIPVHLPDPCPERGALTWFVEQHERAMKLIVVRRDLVGFQLLRAAMRADGIWTTKITLATAGVWRAFADFATDRGPATRGGDLFRRRPVRSHRPAGARQHCKHRGYEASIPPTGLVAGHRASWPSRSLATGSR
jgi:hypothetical protein